MLLGEAGRIGKDGFYAGPQPILCSRSLPLAGQEDECGETGFEHKQMNPRFFTDYQPSIVTLLRPHSLEW